MGTTSDKLTYLNETKQEIKDGINAIGGSLDNEDTFRSYAEELENLYNEMPKVTGTGTELTLNNTRKGKLELELGSNIYQDSTTGKQLLNFTDTTFTDYNVQTIIQNGIITLNNTPSSTSYNHKIYTYTATQSGTYTLLPFKSSTNSNIRLIYKINGGSFINGDANPQISLSNEDVLEIHLRIDSTNTITNFVLKPMLYLGTNETNWEPYTGGIPAPNPTFPMDIHIVTGNNEVDVLGKNLFDVTSASLVQKGITSSTGTISGTNLARLETDNLILLKSGTYTISNSICNNYWIWAYDLNQNYLYQKIMNYWYTGNSYTFTINEDLYVRFLWAKSDSSDIDITSDFQIQLEKSSTATTYEPFSKQAYSINLGDIEYSEIGDYKDRIFKNVVGDTDYSSERELGKWYIKKNIGKVVLDGSETWALETNGSFGLRSSNLFSDRMLFNTSFEGLLSNYYKVVSSGDYYIRWRGSNEYNVNIKNKDISVASDFQTWLSTHNVKVKYVLATPTYTLLPNELQTQLNNLEKALSNNEQTNISQINTDLPFILVGSALKEWE